MNGISNMLAALLLVGILALVFVSAGFWFTNLFNSATEDVERQRQADIEAQGKKIRIYNYNDSSNILVIKNSGSFPIYLYELGVFVFKTGFGDNYTQCTWNASIILPSESARCDVGACLPGESIKVTAPGNLDVIAC